MRRIEISLAPASDPGTVAIMAAVRRGDDSVLLTGVGTAKSISAGFWEADLRRASPSDGPQGPEPGRGPMEHGKRALLGTLQRWADENGQWWP
jgi:hypothetical protein